MLKSLTGWLKNTKICFESLKTTPQALHRVIAQTKFIRKEGETVSKISKGQIQALNIFPFFFKNLFLFLKCQCSPEPSHFFN